MNCPVEKTFQDGGTHYSEEAGLTKSGEPAHWIVRTSPIRDETGESVRSLRARLQKVVALNLGALAVSGLGLMLVLTGIILS